MKTKHLLTTVAASVAILTTTVNASEILLSPKASDSRPHVKTAVTQQVWDFGVTAGSPRLLEQRNQKVSGTTTINLIAQTRNAVASPRALETFPHLGAKLANPTAPALAGTASK